MTTTTMLWRRLDQPGHDAARLVERADGARLEGTAVFARRAARAGSTTGSNATHHGELWPRVSSGGSTTWEWTWPLRWTRIAGGPSMAGHARTWRAATTWT